MFNYTEWRKAYVQKNRARLRRVHRQWRKRNLEKLALRMRQYRKLRPDNVRKCETKRTRPKDYRKNFNLYRIEWGQKNREKEQAYYQKRRAALSANNTLTAAEIKSQRLFQSGLCYYCDCELDNNGLGHIDHKTPLVRGGFNEASNIVIACSKCNLRKSVKTEKEFKSNENLGNRSRNSAKRDTALGKRTKPG